MCPAIILGSENRDHGEYIPYAAEVYGGHHDCKWGEPLPTPTHGEREDEETTGTNAANVRVLTRSSRFCITNNMNAMLLSLNLV